MKFIFRFFERFVNKFCVALSFEIWTFLHGHALSTLRKKSSLETINKIGWRNIRRLDTSSCRNLLLRVDDFPGIPFYTHTPLRDMYTVCEPRCSKRSFRYGSVRLRLLPELQSKRFHHQLLIAFSLHFRLFSLLVNRTSASCVAKWVIWQQIVRERQRRSQENLMKKVMMLALLKSPTRLVVDLLLDYKSSNRG